MPKVSIVILTWNSLAYLKRFMPVLLENTSSDQASIVVADNASTDGTQEWIRERFTRIELISFERNLGYAGGYYQALKSVLTPYAVLLNSDVEVKPDWLDSLIEFMESHPRAGAIAPKVLSYQHKRSFEYAGAAGGWIDRYGFPFCRGRIFNSIEEDHGQYEEPEQVFWASGACLMVRMKAYRETGKLDEHFFAHMEEIDLCWRMHAMGYEVWYFPGSSVYHVGGGTLPNEHPFKLFLNFRNNLLMLYKNLPKPVRRQILLVRFFLDGIAALQYLLRGRTGNVRAVWKAHREFRRMASTRYKSYRGPLLDRMAGTPGFYNGSIVWDFYLKGVRRFNQLRIQR